MNQGPVYYGDLDEDDGGLLQYEQEAEEEGKQTLLVVHASMLSSLLRLGRGVFECQRGIRAHA